MEKTESAMMERLEQLLSELRVKAECGKTLNQLVSGLEQFMSTITPNQPKDLDLDLETSSVAEAVPNRERDNNDIRDEDEDEYEYASDYFCLTEVLADVFNRQRDNGIKAAKGDSDATVYFCPFLFSDGCWFAIPPRKVKVKGKRNVLCRVIVEPKHIQPSYVQPFTLGPYLVLIIDATQKNLYELERDVYYINVTKPGAVWVKAPTFIGSEISFFFVANYKIYGLGWSEGDKISLKFIDFHRLEEGLEEVWQSKSPNGYISPRLFDTKRVLAFMLQCKEDSNTSSQVDADLRAFIFTRHHCISYDLTSNALSLSKEVLYKLWDYHVYHHCQGVFVGGTMYMLMKVIGDYCIMACNPVMANVALPELLVWRRMVYSLFVLHIISVFLQDCFTWANHVPAFFGLVLLAESHKSIAPNSTYVRITANILLKMFPLRCTMSLALAMFLRVLELSLLAVQWDRNHMGRELDGKLSLFIFPILLSIMHSALSPFILVRDLNVAVILT